MHIINSLISHDGQTVQEKAVTRTPICCPYRILAREW